MAIQLAKVPLRFKADPVPIFVPGYRLMERRLWLAVQFAQVRGGWFLEFDENDAGATFRYRSAGNTGAIVLPQPEEE